MIPFGSQRGSGSDLAIHLSNAEDNEFVELADLRGSMADDLHGAFSEWEAQAHAMTNAKKYLYSLSINPDQSQGRLSREQYQDYIERAEESLGLIGQPRATVFHVKASKDGQLREHCHVVWSRIDAQECKAIHIPFDQRKLMAVTRQFAHDHNLTLPEGYHSGRAKNRQLSLYEKAHLDRTGIARAQRQDLITTAWKSSDNAASFVAALEYNGFILAQGRRPYVLVDAHGQVCALPRMINDKSVRSKDVQAFLEASFPSGELPSVENAQERQKHYLAQLTSLDKSEKLAEQRIAMRLRQEERRLDLANEIQAMRDHHLWEAGKLDRDHSLAFAALNTSHEDRNVQIEFNRSAKAPKGLAGFLSRVSGVEFVRRKLHEREDDRRSKQQQAEKIALELAHQKRIEDQRKRQQFEMLEFRRRERNLEQALKREQLSLETREEQRKAIHHQIMVQSANRKQQKPAGTELTLGPGGRAPNIAAAVRRKLRPSDRSKQKEAARLGRSGANPDLSSSTKGLSATFKKHAGQQHSWGTKANFDEVSKAAEVSFPVHESEAARDNDDDNEPEI